MNKTTCEGCGKTIVDCRRYSLDALAEFMRTSIPAACREAGISGSSENDARCHGITRRIADRIADELREHPSAIWPEIVDHDIEDAQVPCRECGERFLPRDRRNVYCSRRCCGRRLNRENARRRYQTDAEYRAERNAKTKAYYQECAPALRAAQRRRAGNGVEAARKRARYQSDPEFRQRVIDRQRQYRAKQRKQSEVAP